MKKQIQNQPLNPQSFWASHMGHKDPSIQDQEWSDGNGY